MVNLMGSPRHLAFIVLLVALGSPVSAQGPRFYPDDPLRTEPTPMPVADINARALSEVLEQVKADSLGQTRLRTVLLAAFAVLALLMAAVGVYGVLSYVTAQRTTELGDSESAGEVAQRTFERRARNRIPTRDIKSAQVDALVNGCAFDPSAELSSRRHLEVSVLDPTARPQVPRR